jgi:hypothetical protein
MAMKIREVEFFAIAGILLDVAVVVAIVAFTPFTFRQVLAFIVAAWIYLKLRSVVGDIAFAALASHSPAVARVTGWLASNGFPTAEPGERALQYLNRVAEDPDEPIGRRLTASREAGVVGATDGFFSTMAVDRAWAAALDRHTPAVRARRPESNTGGRAD